MHGAIAFWQTIPWYAWVAIVAILCGTITGIVQMVQSHRERMEMIRQGMNPDAPLAKSKTPEI